ncbi:ABC transporter ATP-binding protein [Aquitalea denitrificans]|uniref:ABC transporter ATP-binding protein n=1 Tax=Aquitalea denitrificans TaxID=519081 RepID=UPI0013593636|nr:ABC transporter ATP-binding protein [Aquitalea denitrificans]
MIEIDKVSKRYGPHQAVDGVSLQVAAGELFGLIGHNGAGKSTLFRMMLGLIPVSQGDIRLCGQSTRSGAFREVRRQLGYLPENVVLYDNLTGLETLHYFARLKGAPRQECSVLLERMGLTAAAGARVRSYSKGMRQRLGFAQALLGNPQLLFLDEPTNGLDPEGVREFYQILREQQDRGVTIVITSHLLSEIQERVSRLAILRAGRLQAVGSLEKLREGCSLPLTFDIRLSHPANDAVRSTLQALQVDRLEISGDRARLACQRGAKMTVLGALSSLGAQVSDLQIREPSLEDVFLGYSGEGR